MDIKNSVVNKLFWKKVENGEYPDRQGIYQTICKKGTYYIRRKSRYVNGSFPTDVIVWRYETGYKPQI